MSVFEQNIDICQVFQVSTSANFGVRIHIRGEDNPCDAPPYQIQFIVESRCGNGRVEPTEACDDGNDVDEDECNNACQMN